MINKAILMGRLTTTPTLRSTQNGVSVTSFSIAVQRQFKGSDGNYITDFINIVAWRNTAEFITKFFEKGQLIGIAGSIQTRNYEDDNGNKRTAVEVIADEVHFVESKKDSSRFDNAEFKAPEVTGGNDVKFEEIEDEDLPF